MKSPSSLSAEDFSRVIGVYAYSKAEQVLLYEDACVIGGSEELIKKYMLLLADNPTKKMKISKIRFGAIYAGLKTGAVYAFDHASYKRFYSFARRAGIDDLDGLPERSSDEFQFMKVRFNQAG